jgi:hypothetical protein
VFGLCLFVFSERAVYITPAPNGFRWTCGPAWQPVRGADSGHRRRRSGRRGWRRADGSSYCSRPTGQVSWCSPVQAAESFFYAGKPDCEVCVDCRGGLCPGVALGSRRRPSAQPHNSTYELVWGFVNPDCTNDSHTNDAGGCQFEVKIVHCPSKRHGIKETAGIWQARLGDVPQQMQRVFDDWVWELGLDTIYDDTDITPEGTITVRARFRKRARSKCSSTSTTKSKSLNVKLNTVPYYAPHPWQWSLHCFLI